MGVYDRDWWRERYNQRTEKKAGWRRPPEEGADAIKKATYNPRMFRSSDGDAPPTRAPQASPPDLPGSNWHWTVKLMALAWCATLLYLGAKLAMGLPL